jgi:hypothetical protein
MDGNRQAMAALAMLTAMSISAPHEYDYRGATTNPPKCRIGTKASKVQVSSRERRREKKRSRKAKAKNR